MNAFKIIMLDRANTIPVEQMRKLFEAAVDNTPSLQRKVNLAVVEEHNAFAHYMDSDTDAMWLGFAVGLRCAERMNRASGATGGVPG